MPALCGVLAALTACGSAREPAGSYPLIPADERAAAVSFFGLDADDDVASVRSRIGQVQLVVYDVAPLASRQQLQVVREVQSALNRRGVTLLRVALDARQIRSHEVVHRGRMLTDPRVRVLMERAFGWAGAGLGYTEIVDRQGRVAGRLVGTSDPDRLQATLLRLVAG